MTDLIKYFICIAFGFALCQFTHCQRGSGEETVYVDTSSHEQVFTPEPIIVTKVDTLRLIKTVYRSNELPPDTVIMAAICDSLSKERKYVLNAGDSLIDITASLTTIGYLDSSKIAWKHKIMIPQVIMPSGGVYGGAFIGTDKTFGAQVDYVAGRLKYSLSYDSEKTIRAGVGLKLFKTN